MRVNEHIPKCVLKFLKEKTNKKTKAVINATQRFSIAKHLINNVDCANNYDLSRFKVTKKCTNSIYFVRLEVILTFINKPDLIMFLYLFKKALSY